MADEFCLKMPDFHVTFRNLLHAANMRHGTNGFTFLRKERSVEDFFRPEKSDGFGRVWTRELGYQRPTHGTYNVKLSLHYIWRPSHWYRQGCVSIQCCGNNSIQWEFIDSLVSTRGNGNTDPVTILISCCQNWTGPTTWLEWRACTNVSKKVQ